MPNSIREDRKKPESALQASIRKARRKADGADPDDGDGDEEEDDDGGSVRRRSKKAVKKSAKSAKRTFTPAPRIKVTAAERMRISKGVGMEVDEFQNLLELGFDAPKYVEGKRLIVSSEAHEKCGKTHWALTAPKPLCFIDTDLGTEGVMHKFGEHKGIFRREFSLRRQREIAGEKWTQSDAAKEWDAIRECTLAIVAQEGIRTLVYDTGTEMWEMCRMAHFGKLEQVKSHHYAAPNAEFREFAKFGFGRDDLNVVFVHKVKKLYKNDKWSGKFEMAGMNDMPYITQVHIRHDKSQEWVEDDDGEDVRETTHSIEVVNCRQNPNLEGEVLEGRMCSFSGLALAVFPNSKPKDWR